MKRFEENEDSREERIFGKKKERKRTDLRKCRRMTEKLKLKMASFLASCLLYWVVSLIFNSNAFILF
jgi:hypothetical protein